MSFITSYCHLSNNNWRINGKIILQNDTSSVDILKQAYKELQVDYSKFYKMDTLSKAGFIGVEMMKDNYSGINIYKDDEIALLFSNSSSSADTDKKFYNSYNNVGAPSPSLFVYTLPNILIGEIAIRNKWFGENLFIISGKFNPDFYQDYCEIALSKNSKACMCGYVEVFAGKIDAFLFFVEKSDKTELNLPLTSKILANLYKL